MLLLGKASVTHRVLTNMIAKPPPHDFLLHHHSAEIGKTTPAGRWDNNYFRQSGGRNIWLLASSDNQLDQSC